MKSKAMSVAQKARHYKREDLCSTQAVVTITLHYSKRYESKINAKLVFTATEICVF
jgi:hypothetical protein